MDDKIKYERARPNKKKKQIVENLYTIGNNNTLDTNCILHPFLAISVSLSAKRDKFTKIKKKKKPKTITMKTQIYTIHLLWFMIGVDFGSVYMIIIFHSS